MQPKNKKVSWEPRRIAAQQLLRPLSSKMPFTERIKPTLSLPVRGIITHHALCIMSHKHQQQPTMIQITMTQIKQLGNSIRGKCTRPQGRLCYMLRNPRWSLTDTILSAKTKLKATYHSLIMIQKVQNRKSKSSSCDSQHQWLRHWRQRLHHQRGLRC